MKVRETVTFVCRAPPSLRRQWYGDLARLLAASRAPAAALFESEADGEREAETILTVRPAGVVRALRESPAGTSVELEERTAKPPAPPPSFRGARLGFVTRAVGPRNSPHDDEHATIDRIGIRAAVAAGGWLGLQTFWLPTGRGTLWLARRFRVAARTRTEVDRRFFEVGTAVAAAWCQRLRLAASFREGTFGQAREWRNGGIRTIPTDGWFERSPEAAARTALSTGGAEESSAEQPLSTPAIVLGASGAGKTTFLARETARRVRRGEAVVVIDVHGDISPAVLARLEPEFRARVLALDVTARPVPGIAALALQGSLDRAVAHLVAAVKRLTPDGTDLYWGFRLERVFDTFVRLAVESGGSLLDVYDLLTNPGRREAARLSTRSAELARFLDELSPVVRRNPEFLWSAATRLSKLVLVPALRELLAPEGGGLPVEALLAEGRSVFVRLPFASLGPEGSAFAATLVLGRVYLGLAALAEERGRRAPVFVVLDESHVFSPRLVAELVTEGRKFGLHPVIATQYPERLAHELQAAARGALRGFVAFRVPRPSAVEVGAWLGLGPSEAVELLPNLPTGHGLARDPSSEEVRPIVPEGTAPVDDPATWQEAVTKTRREFVLATSSLEEGSPELEPVCERLLLAVLAKTEAGEKVRREDVVAAAVVLPGTALDPALLAHGITALFRDGSLGEGEAGVHLTPAGERRLGLTTPTEATRETAEHRALLMGAFRLFARRGYRLEILRQGRFDTTLPDARLCQLPDRTGALTPAQLASEVERAREGWAWNFFRGRDVFVEAEVSGALRPERIRHGVAKARAHGAFVVFVVGDAARARRARDALKGAGVGPDRAQVWTLPTGLARPDAHR